MQQRYFHGDSSPSPPDQTNPSPTEQQQQQQSKRSLTRRSSMVDSDGLPVYDPRSAIGKRENGRSRLAEKWVHAIPIVVLLCLFILWWFRYPVTLEIKEGRIVAIHPINHDGNRSSTLNITRLEIAFLAVAAISPDVAAVPLSFTGENGASPVSRIN